MAKFEVYFPSDIERAILGGLVLMVQTAQSSGDGNVEFLNGAVAAYRHQAQTFGLDWAALETQAAETLKRDQARQRGDWRIDG